jgi:hypothetical protein
MLFHNWPPAPYPSHLKPPVGYRDPENIEEARTFADDLGRGDQLAIDYFYHRFGTWVAEVEAAIAQRAEGGPTENPIRGAFQNAKESAGLVAAHNDDGMPYAKAHAFMCGLLADLLGDVLDRAGMEVFEVEEPEPWRASA